MSPAIENPEKLALPAAAEQVLQAMFAGYRRVVIKKTFGSSLSGGCVIEVRPIKADGTSELPAVVKLAAISLVEKEWLAYQRHIRHRLPNVAEITAEPVPLPETCWSGLRYPLMGGGGTFEIVTLCDYCRREEVTVDDIRSVLERLFRIMERAWNFNYANSEFHMQPSYDRLLPVNLLITPPSEEPGLITPPSGGPGGEEPHLITPDFLPQEPLKPGDFVRVSGFAVSKVDLVNQTVTLNRPETSPVLPAYYLRLKSPSIETMASYQVNQIMDPVEGEVVETRTSRLHDEVRRALGEDFDPTAQTLTLPDQTSLPNPLATDKVSSLLNKTRDVRVASIHGDFNLENILIEPETGAVSLIDFAEAREDHILHDFLRLETEVVTKLIPGLLQRHNLPLIPTLASFYRQLHLVAFQAAFVQPTLPHSDLEKPFAMLVAVRQAAYNYLFDRHDFSEYYEGLILYLVGALKFKNLNDMSEMPSRRCPLGYGVPEQPLPKQVAFWSAALVAQLLIAPPDSPEPKAKPEAPFQALHNVPQFVGREQELDELRHMLTTPGEQNMVCLTGMGGVGKTALATRLAHTLRHHFADGVLWANMATSEPLAILDSWARAYGYDFSSLPDLDSRAAALRGELADKKTLMILDDVWHADQVRSLLPGGSQCVVLLTSRDLDLSVALGAREFRVSVLTSLECRQLLARIVGDERVRAEEPFADGICRLLGNLPLAVKIAARRLASRSRWRLADLAARLRDEKNRLEELKLRDREVRASLAISWAVLDEELRRIFALLAVFEGRPFRTAALAAVAEIDRPVAEDKLYALVSLSLVSEEGEVHYRQHPLLADFAREQLGQDEAAYARMIQYYLAYATEHQHNYFELEQEGDNFLASMRLAYQRKMWPLIIDYAELLVKAGFARARFSDIRQACQWACEAAKILGNHPALAAGLRQWGRACIEQGDYAEAEEHLSNSLQICLEQDDQPGAANAQYHLGRIAIERSDYAEAQRWLEESLRIRTQLGDVAGVAETLYQQANVQYEYRNLEEAKVLAEQTLAMQQTAGDKLGAIRTFGLLADIALKQNEPDPAKIHCQHALTLCEEIQEQGELAVMLYILSEALRRQGDLKFARDYAEQSLILFTRMGDRKMQARSLWRLSLIDADLKEYTLALKEGLQSLNLHQEEDSWSKIYVLLHLGDVHRSLSQLDQAYKRWSEALSLAEPAQHPLTEQLRERLNNGA